MSDITIKNFSSTVEALSKETSKTGSSGNNQKFDSVINEALGKVSDIQNNVDKAVGELSQGGDVTSAVLAVEKADMTFQVMVEVRNKLLATYQEIMKMQV